MDIGGPRRGAVLALLVIARGGVVPAESLVESVWGERAPADGTGSLHSAISHLRRRLEPERGARTRGSVIVSRGPGYALSLPIEAVDAWEFERVVRASRDEAELQTALDLWRGPAYAEYADEPWAAAEVTRLGELREVARERLVAARLARGEAAVLVPEVEALVAQAPLREERWRLLVLALYRSQRQGDALAALRRARQTLADELGIDPGPALRALEAEVLAQAPSLDVGTTPPAPVVHSAPSTSDDLMDRDLELAALSSAMADALQRKARLVVVRGPAGIGKTRLLAEARRLAEAGGARVCTARGSLLERDFGYGAVRQLFEPVIDMPGVLNGSARAAASVFDLASPVSGEGTLPVLHGLYWLTANLAVSGPVLLSVDDLQWCDVTSLRFLAYLVARMEPLPVLIVATLRTGEPSADDTALAELVHNPATVVIQPGPLSVDAVASLVRDRFGPTDEEASWADFVAACHRTTLGNPLLLRQLLRALQSEGVRPGQADVATVTAVGSRAVSSMVLMRLSRMDPASTMVARAVAVLGDCTALPNVARLANLPEDRAAAVVAALARAEVLRDESPLGFVHPLVADAVYRDIPAGERELVHDRAAHLLHERGSPPEQVAAHLRFAPTRADPWVVEVLRAAAERASDRGAPEAAVSSLVRALQEPPAPEQRIDVLLDLGRLGQLANDARAIGFLTEAYEALAGDQGRRAVVAQMLTRALIFGGGRGEATRFARRAAGDLPADLADERQGLLAQERIAGYMHDLPEADWRRGPDPEVSGEGIGARFLATTLAWEATLDGIDRTRAAELARFGAAGGRLMRIDVGHLWAVAGIVLELADEDTEQYWRDGMAHSQRRGSAFGLKTAYLWSGFYRWRRGELREALQSFRIVSETAWGDGQDFSSGYSDSYAASVLLEQGELAAARSLVAELEGRQIYGEGDRSRAEARADVLLAEGRPAEALASLDSVRDVLVSARNPAWRPWRSHRARILLALGDTDSALSHVDEELLVAREWGASRPTGRALRVRAEVLASTGAVAPARDSAREAVSLLAPTSGRLEYARALRVLAGLVDADEAAPLLRTAAGLAWTCGAAPDYDGVIAALATLGQPPPPLPAAATRLTTWERDMLTRHLGGATERDIAEALFLAPVTVRAMLGTAREILGATTRAELRSALRAG